MDFQDLIGLHNLSGVDRCTTKLDGAYDDSDIFRFVLDGQGYAAIEDPEDGYRSSMRELALFDASEIKTSFLPHKVMCSYHSKYDGVECDLLEIVDATTGLPVIVVGTQNTEDYYPWFCGIYNPENLAANK